MPGVRPVGTVEFPILKISRALRVLVATQDFKTGPLDKVDALFTSRRKDALSLFLSPCGSSSPSISSLKENIKMYLSEEQSHITSHE
jgi:hypothetical protein